MAKGISPWKVNRNGQGKMSVPKRVGGAIGRGKKPVRGPFDNPSAPRRQLRGKAPFSAGRIPNTGLS